MTLSTQSRRVRYVIAAAFGLMLALAPRGHQALAQDGLAPVYSSRGPELQRGGIPGMWDSVCDCVKAWRRHLRRSHQEVHRHLYHPKYEPHFANTYGFYQTQWGVFPGECGMPGGLLMVGPTMTVPNPARASHPLNVNGLLAPGATQPDAADASMPPNWTVAPATPDMIPGEMPILQLHPQR